LIHRNAGFSSDLQSGAGTIVLRGKFVESTSGIFPTSALE